MNEIGEILKEARVKKGYTLDDLQQMTKIQKRYLKAIEENQLNILPGAFYAKAFIKQYADIVGLDGAGLIKSHEEQVLEGQSEESSEPISSAIGPKVKKTTEWTSRLQEILPTILIVLLVLTIVIAIYVAWRQSVVGSDDDQLIQESGGAQIISNKEPETDNKESEQKSKPTENEDKTEEKQELKITNESSTGATSVFAVTGELSKDASFKLIGDNGETWVSITDNLRNSVSDTLSNGQEISLPIGEDVKEIIAVIGNAPATLMELDGEKIEYPSEAANAVRQEITFTIEQP